MLELQSLNENGLSFHLKDLKISRSETKPFESLHVYWQWSQRIFHKLYAL